ncbi:hypothetical protein MBLNU13_g07243t2 [Cladosporium sp. NU13]
MTSDQRSQNPTLSTPDPSHTAQSAVFQTLELLETILDNLSFLDLAACQSVSRYFSTIIRGSSALRPKLSRETVRTVTLRYLPTSGGAFGFSLGPEITPRKLCPLLTFDHANSHGGGPPDCFPKMAAKLAIGRYFASEASWENVYLTNPPVAEAWISISWKVDSEEFEGTYSECRRINSENGEGLTVGRLYKGLLEQRRWTASCGARRKGVPYGRGSYMCARADTVAGSIARLEELTGCKAEVAKEICSVYFPRMIHAVRR